MANIASARKRARQSEKRRQHNASLRSELRSAVKRSSNQERTSTGGVGILCPGWARGGAAGRGGGGDSR